MKTKYFFKLIVGFALLMFSCNNDVIDDPDDDTETISPEPEPDPDKYNFTQSELDLIDSLIHLIPVEIIAGFEAKYNEWEEAWNRPEFVAISVLFGYTLCEEYDNLVDYCKKFSKIIWPLVIDKYVNEHKVLYLLKDVIYEGTDFFEEISEKYGCTDRNEQYMFAISDAIAFCKNMLATEKDNLMNIIRLL